MTKSKKDKTETLNGKSDSKMELIRSLIFPIMNTTIGVLLLVFITDLKKPKTGELKILCNVDSTEVYLDGKPKGITGPLEENENMSVLNITSIYPGSYVLLLKKKYFRDELIIDVAINPGYRTSKSVMLTPLSTKEEYNKTDLNEIDKSPRQTQPKHIITHKTPNVTKAQDNSDLSNTIKDSNFSQNDEDKGTTNELRTTTSHIKRKLSIWLTEQIQVSEVNFFVNSKYTGQLPSYHFSVELDKGMNEITLIYKDAIQTYMYSKIIKISRDDTLIIKKNEFKPKI